KLINQVMILGESAFVYRLGETFIKNLNSKFSEVDKNNFEILRKKYEILDRHYISENLFKLFKKSYSNPSNEKEIKHTEEKESIKNYFFNLVVDDVKKFKLEDKIHRSFFPLLSYKSHVNINYVDGNKLDFERISKEEEQFKNAQFIREDDGTFTVSREVEKMSKSKYNVVNPDDICDQYGADTLRMYEMFLGPLEQAKPWNMAGITGVHNFLKKFWKLYHNSGFDSAQLSGEDFYVSNDPASKDSLKTLHKTIKKVEEDIENFSFNTSVSTFMIAVNELTAQKCSSREVLKPLAILISPYAPHIAEELWSKLGHSESIATAPFPQFDASHLVESTKEYPISFNGKMRFTLEMPLDLSKEDIEKTVMAHEKTQQYLEGRTPKKVIVVPGKIVNIVG
ncbi:MAG: class I tRNA ligase family protein, partial [Candidatus Paceibacterota bacterium]